MSAQVRQATSAEDHAAVRALCRAYRAALVEATRDRPEVAETYYAREAFEDLLRALPRLHGEPDGAIYLATLDGAPQGCGMIHRIDADTCEIKRVYVAEAARGTGLGRAIVTHAMADARARGYGRMVLDTMAPLAAAAGLYTALGFTPCPPFYTPDPDHADYLRFFARDL